MIALADVHPGLPGDEPEGAVDGHDDPDHDQHHDEHDLPVGAQPGVEGASLAPNLSEFRVPTDKLIVPTMSNDLSISEGEVLWQGPDLNKYLVNTTPNPYALPAPPPSFGAG